MSHDSSIETSGGSLSRRALLQGTAAVAGGFLVASAVGAPASAAETKPFIPSNLKYAANDPLAAFFAKVAKGTATVVMAGDSITEGYGAATPLKAYPARVRAKLRKGPTGGLDYLPARHQYVTAKPPAATTTYFTYYNAAGTAVNLNVAPYSSAVSSRFGLGRRAVLLAPGAVNSVSFQQRFTSFRLSWRAFFAVPTSIRIQYGTVDRILTSTDDVGQVFESGPLSSASRKVTITYVPVAGQKPENLLPYIEGVEVFDGDEGRGFHIVEAAQTGSMTSGFSSESLYGGQPGSDVWAERLASYEPDLITSMWGTNDVKNRIGPDALRGHTLNYLDLAHKATPNAALLVIMPFRLGSVDATLWAQYRSAQEAAVIAFAKANPSAKISFLDLGTYIPAYFGNKTQYMVTDGIHPNDAGYEVIAAILYAYFTSTPA
jgi:lysophospholipase L1-like esterase